ncbi:MAG: hypothetical protein WCF03_12565, partial [Nitrososphaeraceae archaeon]
MTCGQDNNEHPTNGIPQCLTLRNGRKNGKFGSMRRYNIKTNENEFAFNLHTVEEWKQFQDGALNYPEPIESKFC